MYKINVPPSFNLYSCLCIMYSYVFCVMNLSIQTLKCQQLHARKCQQYLSNKVINDWDFQVRWPLHAELKNNVNKKKKYASFQKENDL